MQQEWRDVEIKKPPNGHSVLVAVFDARPKVKMHFIHIAERLNNDYFDEHGNSLLGKERWVTHWMPLPDVPEVMPATF